MMFRIGEFSKLVRVSARMLRHYEKCGLLYPSEIDKYTGYRLYSAGQIPLLSKIVALRDAGFSIDEIGDILQRFDDRQFMESILQAKQREVSNAIAAEQDKLNRLMAMRENLNKERTDMISEIELKELPAVKVLSLREIIPAYDAEGMLWEKLGAFMAQNRIECVGAGGYSIYHDAEYKESDVDVEIAVPVDVLGGSSGEFVFKELDAIPLAVTARFSGPYENYTPTMEKIGAWMEQNGYEFAGNIRGLAIASPGDVESPEDYLTEIQVPVRKK